MKLDTFIADAATLSVNNPRGRKERQAPLRCYYLISVCVRLTSEDEEAPGELR